MAKTSEDEESDYFDDDDFEPIFSVESDSDNGSEIDLSVLHCSYIEIVQNVAENIEQDSVSLGSDYESRQKCFDFTGIFFRSFFTFTFHRFFLFLVILSIDSQCVNFRFVTYRQGRTANRIIE